MEEKLYINMRHLTGEKIKVPMYVNHNGVMKRYLPSPLARKSAIRSGIWVALDDLPTDIKAKINSDATIKESELMEYFRKDSRQSTYASNEDMKLHLTNNTLLLPIVDNFLPYDGIRAYTVIEKNGKPALKEFVIGVTFHWSELYTGQTKYGNNVFCLAQDLPKEVQEKYADSFIRLSEAFEYLEKDKVEEPKIL